MYVGVTVIVADCALVDVFTTEKEPISPVPAEGNPIEVFVLVQLYSVTPSVFSVVNWIGSVSSSLHNIWLSIGFTWAPGFTVRTNVSDGPVHSTPLLVYVGVTVIIAFWELAASFITSKLGILPIPLSANPIRGLVFVHSYVVIPSVFVVVNSIGAVTSPSHKSWSSIALTCAVGLTVIENVSVGPSQLTPAFV